MNEFLLQLVHHVVVVVGLAVCFAVVNDVPEPLGRWVDVV